MPRERETAARDCVFLKGARTDGSRAVRTGYFPQTSVLSRNSTVIIVGATLIRCFNTGKCSFSFFSDESGVGMLRKVQILLWKTF